MAKQSYDHFAPDDTMIDPMRKLVEQYGTKAVLRTVAAVCSRKGEELAESEPIMAAAWRQLADDMEALANARAGLR